MTTGSCEALPINEGGTCDDSRLCTEGDVCSAGACQGSPIDCSALDSTCTSGQCNTGTGSCEAVPANEGGSSFQCQIDGGGFSSCSSPYTLAALGEGSHTFDVQATDPAGNTDPTPASYSWTIDATPPNDPTDVSSSDHTVSAPSNDNTITMTWTAATDNVGGSGVDGYAYEFNSTSTPTCDQGKDLEETATTY